MEKPDSQKDIQKIVQIYTYNYNFYGHFIIEMYVHKNFFKRIEKKI